MPIQERKRAAAGAIAIDEDHALWFIDEDGRPRLADEDGNLSDFTGSSILTGSGAPDGSLGKVGDFYVDTDNGDYYTKTGVATWSLEGNFTGGSDLIKEKPAGAINGVNLDFTASQAFAAGSTQLYLNGLLLDEGAGEDYEEISSTVVRFALAPLAGDKVIIVYETEV